jgi:hypothetical protein
MKKNLVIVAIALVAAFGLTGAVQADDEKFQVCHVDNKAQYELIEVGSLNSLENHLANHSADADNDGTDDLWDVLPIEGACPTAE